MSWDPPVGNFVYVLPPLLTNAGIDRPRISRLPPNEDGEWWANPEVVFLITTKLKLEKLSGRGPKDS